MIGAVKARQQRSSLNRLALDCRQRGFRIPRSQLHAFVPFKSLLTSFRSYFNMEIEIKEKCRNIQVMGVRLLQEEYNLIT